MRAVIGVDPGPTPGIVRLQIVDDRLVGIDVVQCSASVLYPVVREALMAWDPETLRIQVERFVARGRASSAQSVTRDQVGMLQASYPHRVTLANASAVKPWATDERLQATVCRELDTSLWQLTAGMKHARDAARHALYAACKTDLLRDPLSRKGGA